MSVFRNLLFDFAGSSGEKIDEYTKLLLHFNDNKFVDTSPYYHEITSSNASISTNGKFGSSFYAVRGNQGYLTIRQKEQYDLCLGRVFTVDFWLKILVVNGYNRCILAQNYYTSGNGYTIRLYDNTVSKGGVLMIMTKDGSSIQEFAIASGEIINDLQKDFCHIAISSDGTTLRGFFNGKLVDSVLLSNKVDLSNISVNPQIGHCNWSYNEQSYLLDELRVTAGKCLWTKDFKVPTKEYK